MHLSKRNYGVLESGAILILTAVDWTSTERACVDRTDQLLNKYADSSHRPACSAKFRWHALVHDIAGHLISIFILVKPNDPAQSDCSPRSMLDPDAFNPVVADLVALQTKLSNGALGTNKITTAGVPWMFIRGERRNNRKSPPLGNKITTRKASLRFAFECDGDRLPLPRRKF